MRSYIALPVLLVFYLAFPARSQQRSQTASPAATPAPVEAQLDVDKAKDTTIVFFREGHFAGSGLKPSIYLDGKEVDRLANGCWFSVHAEPGKHELQSSAKNQPATTLETKAGETTYVQLVIVPGTWRGGGRLLQVDSAEAQKVITKLKPCTND